MYLSPLQQILTNWTGSAYAAGSYVGDGTQNRLINIGFQPILVIIMNYNSSTLSASTVGGFVCIKIPTLSFISNSDISIYGANTLVSNGFIVDTRERDTRYSNSSTNTVDAYNTMYYLAIK